MARTSADDPDRAHSTRALRRDHWLTQGMNLAFATGQAMAAVIVPLLAVQAGHAIEAVGLLVAVSAVSQTAARLGMGTMMSRIPTKHFLIAATVLLAVSCLVLGLSAELWAFVVAQLLQGAARAYFWTGAQTHVVRASESAVRALSRLNVMQGVGQLIGPALAGVIGAWSLQASLFAAAALAAFAIAPSIALLRFPPFASRKKKGSAGGDPRRIWRRPGVSTAASMTAVGGAWRGILNSYLPVILTAAGYSVPVAGALVALTNLASLGGSALSRSVSRLGARASNAIGTTSAGLGLAFASLFPAPLPVVIVALAISGCGAGILQTVGPALAADSVPADDRGRAIASIGTFRSVSLLLSPLATSALVLLLPSAAVASTVAGMLISSPALAALRRPTVAAGPLRADVTQEGEADERHDR